MKFQKTKLSLLIFALAFGGALSGCTSDKNSDSTPPDVQDPGTDNPDDPGTDGPDDPGTEDPDLEPNTPLYQGVTLFQIHELDSVSNPPRMVRSKREINGSLISTQKQDISVDGSEWADVTNPVLTSRIFSSESDSFNEFNNREFIFEGDGQNYVYRFQNTNVKIDVDHFQFDATSQNVKDTVALVFDLPELAGILQGDSQFTGDEEIYLETLEFIDTAIMYNAGKYNGTNCLLWDDTVTSEDASTTFNCNFVVFDDGTTGLSGTTLTPLADEDPASALRLKGSVFMTEDFRLIADAGSTTEGDVIPGATSDIIGAWTMTTVGNRDAILVQLTDTDEISGYVNQSQWKDPDSFYLLRDDEKLRIVPILDAETSLKKPNWLLGTAGIAKIHSSVDLSGGN